MGVHDPMITWDAKEMPAHKVRITTFGVRGVFLVTDFTGRPDEKIRASVNIRPIQLK